MMADQNEMVDPLSIEITIEPESVQRVQKALAGIRAEIPRVLRLAVNAGVSRVRREMEKAAMSILHIERSVLRERLWPRRAKVRQGEDVYGTVRGGRFGWALTKFPVARTPKGLAVQFTDRSVLYPGAFWATMPGGHVGGFQRKGKSRLPIGEIKVESVTDVLEELSASPSIRAAGAKAVEDKIDRELSQIFGVARGEAA